MRDYYGHTVVNGELRHASVSSVKKFDARTKGGCARRWAWDKVFGLKEPDAERNKEAKDKGTDLDRELKHYLRTGDKALSPLALRTLHILEAPGADIGLDVPIHKVHYFDALGVERSEPARNEKGDVVMPQGWTTRVTSPLTAAGVPFIGELDLIHARGHWRDDDGVYHDDPPGTIEIGDIKFKTNARTRQGESTLFLPGDIIRDIQMAGYGEWLSRVRPDTPALRLSMLYSCEKDGNKIGSAKKVTRLHVLDDCHKTWVRVESVVREMKDVARATDIEQVPGAADISTCDAYSGCPHREYCTAYKRNSLDKTYGKLAGDYAQEKAMGLMSSNPQMFQNGAAPQQAPAQQPQQNMQQQLAAEEQQLRQQAQQQQAQMPVQLSSMQLAELCQRIINYGFGFPALGGNLGQLYAAVGGQNVMPGFVFNGVPAPAGAKRSLHSVQINELAHLLSLEGEMAVERGVPAYMQQPSVMPGLAPQQQVPVQQVVQQQAQPVPVPQQPGLQQQIAQQYNANIAQQPQPWQGLQQTPTQQPQALGFLPPDAPTSMPQLAMTQQTPVGATNEAPQGSTNTQPTGNAQSAPKEKKASPGRPKKNQDAAPGQIAASAQGTSPPTNPAPATQVAPAPSSATPTFTANLGPRVVLVNCRSEDIATSSLASYVDYINAETAKKYNWGKDGQQGILDVRAAKEGSVLGYGGWKGAVREIVKVDQPGDGLYHINTNRDDLCEAVVDGLRQAGWLIIRGVFS